MSPPSAEVFRDAARENMGHVFGPDLLANHSPLALELFEELVRGTQVDPVSLVDVLHSGLLPNRGIVEVLNSLTLIGDQGVAFG